MSRARAAATAPRTHAPHAPRRVSGPARPLPRRAPAPAPGRDRPRPVAPPRGMTFGATVAAPPLPRGIRSLPDHRLVDGLLRSRAWIWIIGIALGGIVAMQVSLLKLNAGISTAVETAVTLERSNAQLAEEVAELSSGERIRAGATDLGLITPDAGRVGYLSVRPDADPARAVRRMTPPSDAARELLANGGRAMDPIIPAAAAPVAAAPVVPVAAPVTTTTTAPAPAPTAAPPADPAATQPYQAPAQSQPQTVGTTGAAAAPSDQG